MTKVGGRHMHAQHSLATRSTLKVDLLLPTYEGMLNGGTPRWADVVSIAKRAEALGFDGLWVVDHLVIPVD